MRYSESYDPPAPLATVRLGNSQTLNSIPKVSMLLDTGANVTLLPQSFCEKIGVGISETEFLELEGFSQTRSVFFCIRLDLIFLNKLFRGKFLAINQTEGIIGRDILNQFAISFNGKNAEWSVQK